MDKTTATPQEESETEAMEEQIVSAQPKDEGKKPSGNRLLISILILLIILGAGYYFLMLNPNLIKISSPDKSAKVQPTAVDVSSDPQIDKDIQALNNNMNSLDTDFNNIDYGLNDKPVTE